MLVSAPHAKRDKRFHVVLFMDSSSTRNYSFRFGTLWFLGLTFLAASIVWAVGIYLFLEIRAEKDEMNSYIRELKSVIVAHGLRDLKASSSEFFASGSETQKDPFKEINSLASEIRSAALVSDQGAGAVKVLGALNLEIRQGTPEQTPMDSAVIPALPAEVTGTSGTALSSAGAAPSLPELAGAPPPAPLESEDANSQEESEVKIESFVLSRGKAAGTSTLTFALVKQDQSDPARIVGRICGFAEIKRANGTIQVALPSGRLLPNGAPDGSCSGGSLVKFSKLRPLEMNISYPQEQIAKVVLKFSDLESQETHLQTFENSKSN
jgi:hypothetical protein